MAGADRHAKLAEQILDAVLGMGLRRGDRLVEKQLAETCNVSRTPIRSALKFLEAQGVAEKPEDGGFVLACDADDAVARLRAGSGGRDGELAERIIRDRNARRLDSAVNISDLIRRYAVTRNAAQKALETLQRRGVIERAEGQSWVFARMPGDRAALADSYDFRLMLEPQAILSPGFRLDEARATLVRTRTEALLAQSDHSIDPADFREIDLAFHRLIARSSGNAFVTEALMAHHGLRAMAGDSGDLNDFRIRQALDEHVRILDYLSQDQYELAADLMRVHLRISRNRRPSVANRGAPALAFALRAAR